MSAVHGVTGDGTIVSIDPPGGGWSFHPGFRARLDCAVDEGSD